MLISAASLINLELDSPIRVLLTNSLSQAEEQAQRLDTISSAEPTAIEPEPEIQDMLPCLSDDNQMETISSDDECGVELSLKSLPQNSFRFFN